MLERGSGSGTGTQCDKGKQVVGESSSAAWEWVETKNGTRVQLRGPIDEVWSHGEKYKRQGFKCAYCPCAKDSGNKSRLREHLAGLHGNVVPCLNVPNRVREIMLQVHAKGRKSRADAKERRLYVEKAILEEAYGDARRANIPNDEAGQIEWALRESLRGNGVQGSSPPLGRSSTRASNSTPPIDRARFSGTQTTMDRFCRSPSVSNAPFDIDLERSKMPSQRRVDVMLQGGAKEKLGKALAKWFHANDIPGRKADCPYFVAAIKLAQQLGDVSIPKGKDIDGPLLDMNYDDLRARMDDYKENWDRFGVTIMCDSWTGPTMMCIINFMIFCNGRMFFHKTVDATGCIQNADFIYDCIREVVIEEVGEKRVVQLVTDNGSNYKKACKQLTAKYQHITWQPCAAHTINLMLKDIARFDEVDELLYGAKRMCRFFYKHNRLHAMMKEKIGGELVRWNATRFGDMRMTTNSPMIA